MATYVSAAKTFTAIRAQHYVSVARTFTAPKTYLMQCRGSTLVPVQIGTVIGAVIVYLSPTVP